MSPEFVGHIVRLVAVAMVGAMLLSGLRSIIAARRRAGSPEDIMRLDEPLRSGPGVGRSGSVGRTQCVALVGCRRRRAP